MKFSGRRSGAVLGSMAILCAVAWAGDVWKAPASAKNLKNPVPAAETVKLALAPGQLVKLTGALTTATFWFTVNLALLVAALPHTPLTTAL